MTLSDELRAYDATNNAVGANRMMAKTADVVDEMSACLRLLTEKGVKQSTGLSWSKRLRWRAMPWLGREVRHEQD